MYWTDEIMGIGQNRMGGNRRCPDPSLMPAWITLYMDDVVRVSTLLGY